MANSQRTARTTVNEADFGSGDGEVAAVDAWEAQLALDDGEELQDQGDQGGNAPKKPVEDHGALEDDNWADDDLDDAPEGEDDDPEDDDPEGEEEDDSEDDEEEDDSPTHPLDLLGVDPKAKVNVKINGEETEVTFQELKDGYSRTQDYTQKTQDIANQRKALEAEKQATAEQKQQWSGYLDQMGSAIKAVLGQRTPEEWAKLEQTDRYTYLEERQKEQQLKDRLAAVESEKQRTNQEKQKQQQDQWKEIIRTETEALHAALPEWKSNPQTAERERTRMVQYAKTLGFNEQEVNSIVDHRTLLVLRDAARLHALTAKKAKGTQQSDKVRTAPKGRLKAGSPQRGGAKAVSQRKSAQRLAKSGSTDAAAAYFETTLD